MTNKLEQAAQALLAHWDTPAWRYLKPTGDLIAALRKALDHSGESNEMVAEQVEKEPVAWLVYTADGQSVYVTDNPTDIKDGQRALPLYTNSVEPEKQEPVCFVVQDELGLWWASDKQSKYTDSIPVYAAPVRTKDLTDDEIYPLYNEPTSDREAIDFARAVISKDREKNK